MSLGYPFREGRDLGGSKATGAKKFLAMVAGLALRSFAGGSAGKTMTLGIPGLVIPDLLAIGEDTGIESKRSFDPRHVGPHVAYIFATWRPKSQVSLYYI
jgi:hypothetical protein